MPPAHQSSTSGQTATLAVVSAGTALVLMVFTLPLTTLASTVASLSAGAGAQAWLLSAMPLGCAIGLLPGGALADDRGRRLVFIAGLALMGITLGLGAAAPNAFVLNLLRVLQGIGGSAVMACGLGLLAHAYPDRAGRAHATAIWAGSLGAGVALGPILAAMIDAAAGWRAVYASEALLAIGLALTARLLLAESRSDQPRPVDLLGSTTLGVGMAALLAGLTEARADPGRPLVLLLVAAGVVLIAAFFVIERRTSQPMLDLSLFRRGDFTGAIVGAFASGIGVLALMSVVPTILQRAYGMTPLGSAFVLLAWSATSSVAALAARRLPAWASPPRVMVAGLLGCAIGQFGVGFVGADTSVMRFVPPMILAGVANGLLNAALGAEAIASVPVARAAMGSGANNTARYLGSAFGFTVIAIIIGHAGKGDRQTSLLHAWSEAVIFTATFSVLGAALIVALHHRGRKHRLI